jgi:hypothetical protein
MIPIDEWREEKQYPAQGRAGHDLGNFPMHIKGERT